eukprot:5218897-Amphidinium_carterae.1
MALNTHLQLLTAIYARHFMWKHRSSIRIAHSADNLKAEVYLLPTDSISSHGCVIAYKVRLIANSLYPISFMSCEISAFKSKCWVTRWTC